MAIDNNDFTHEFQIYSTDKNAGTMGTGEFMLFDNNINALTIKDISNIKINGGEEGQILTTDGAGNLTWITSTGGGGVQVNADWNSSSGASRILNKPDLTAYLPKSGGTLTGKLSAAQGAGTAGGYSFGGTEGGADTGMFSNADGILDFYANNVKIVTVTTGGITSTQAITLPSNPTSNLQAATKQYVDSSVGALNNFSGNYTDLTNKPTVATSAYIGTTQIAFDRASGSLTLTGVNIDGNAATVSNGVYTTGTYANPVWITSLAYSKLTGAPTLAAVATSGSYSDLSNKPSIPDLTGYATESWVTSQGYGSGTGGQTFDQSLNTTNSVMFNNLALTGSIDLISGAEISSNNAGSIDLFTDWGNGGVEVWLQHGDKVAIRTADGNYAWNFDANGKLTLPELGQGLGWTNTDTAPTPDTEFLYSSTISFDKNQGVILTNNVGGNNVNWTFDNYGNLTAPGNVTIAGRFVNTDDGYLNLRGSTAGPTSRIHLRNYNDDPTSDVNVHLQTGNAGQTFELFQLGASHATYPYSGGLRSNSASAPIIVQTDTDNANNTWEFGLDGTLTTPGSIIPATDNAVDLGSPTNRFRHLYVAPGTIYLGDIKLTNLNGKLDAKKVVNPGEENEYEDNEDSDAFSPLRGGGGSSALEGLDDVQLDGPSNGQVLTWNSSQEKWENQDPSGGGTGATNEITNTSPEGSTYSVSVGTDGVVTMTTARGGLEFGAMPEVGGPTHFHIMRPANENGSGGTDLYFGDDYNYVLQRPAAYGQAPAYGVEIGTNDKDGGSQNVWRFGTDGHLTLPAGGDIKDSTGASVLGSGAGTGNLIITGDTIKGTSIGQVGTVFVIQSDTGLNPGVATLSTGGTFNAFDVPYNEDTLAIQAGWTVTTTNGNYNDSALPLTFTVGSAVPNGTEYISLFATSTVQFTCPDSGTPIYPITIKSDDYVAGSDPVVEIQPDSTDSSVKFTFDGTDLKLPAGGDIKDSSGNSVLGGGSGNSLAPELTKSGGNLVASTTLEFQGNMYGAIFDIDSGGNFDVWIQTVTGDSEGTSYAIGSNDDGYNFVYAFSASGTVAWKVGLDDISGNDNTAYGIKYKSGYVYLSCQYYNSNVGENQVSVLKLNADDGTVNDTWILTNNSQVQYRPRDIAVTSSGDPIVIGESFNETQTYSGLTPQTGSGSQVLVINGSDLNNAVQTNPWGSYYVHTDPNDPNAWYSVQSVNRFFNVPTVVLTGTGDGTLTVNVRYMYYPETSSWRYDWVEITNSGSGYNLGDQVKVLGSSIGGTDGVDDIILSSNGWYMNVLSVGGVDGSTCPSFVSDKVRFTTSQTVDFSTGTWDVRIGLGSQAFVWTPNWQHSYGNAEGQEFMSVSVDSSDNVYLLGDFEYYDGSNYHRVLAMKLNSSGVQQWTKYIEDNTGSQDPGTITVDSSGNCFIINQNNNGYTLVTKLDSAGDLVWQVKQVDNNNWNNYCVGGVDSNGDVIVMGSWYGNNNNNYVTNIHKLSGADGSLVWSRDFGNQQDYDMYEYYDEDGQAGHVVGDSFYYGGYCYDANNDRDVGFGFRLPADGTGTGTYGRYVYSTNNDTQYVDNASNAVLTNYTYNAIDSVSMIIFETSASTTADAVGETTSNHWFIGTGGGLTGVDSITFSDGTVLTTAGGGGGGGGGGWTPGNDIVQTVDTNLRIVVKDPNENSYRLDLAVEDDNGNVKTRMDMDYNRVQIEANNGQRQWQFDSNGEFRIPGTISTFDNDINIVAMNAGNAGNITIKTVANYNNVHFSSIDITQNGVNITTDMDNTPGGKTFEFRDSGILVLPQGSDIQNASGVSVLGTEPKFTLNYQSFNAEAGKRYCIDAVGSAVTATLPASANVGDAIYFVDAYGSFNTNNFTIDGNGNNIMGSSTQVITTANESIGVFFNGTEWRFYG